MDLPGKLSFGGYHYQVRDIVVVEDDTIWCSLEMLMFTTNLVVWYNFKA